MTKSPTFRERLTDILRDNLYASQFSDETGRSVDGEIRVSRVDFKSLPEINSISDDNPASIRINGSIKIELHQQICVHGGEEEEQLTEPASYICDFWVEVKADPLLRNQPFDIYFSSFQLVLADRLLTKC